MLFLIFSLDHFSRRYPALLTDINYIIKRRICKIEFMQNVNNFLEQHKMRAADINIHKLVESFTAEMIGGLEGGNSSLRMIPTYIEADNEFLTEVPVAAIDAGGTNFRAATVKFTREGKLELTDNVMASMPGLNGEISKEEFFETLTRYIKPITDKCDRIGFCFSYPTEIFPNKDGKLLQFCKEVQAPGVIGEMVGKSLLETLGTPDKQIVLLNDTVATLLAGKSSSFDRDYDSFMGFILGTGTNTCYIEHNKNIIKTKDLDREKSQIINVESGNFGKAPRTEIDIAFDNTTSNPGNYSFEKMFSGGYLGGLCLYTIKKAAEEGCFTHSSTEKVLSLGQLTSEDANNFISKRPSEQGALQSCMTTAQDEANCIALIENLVDRAAKLVAANLAAVLLKTDKGKSSYRPVLITIEGTTFYKMINLKPQFEKYFNEYLSGERKRFYEFTEVLQSSLIGAALAALIE
jgi:hexokinase